MTWYELDSIIKELSRRGFSPTTSNDPGVLVFKGSQKIGPVHPRIVLPMNVGDWLPELTVRKVLSESGFDVDEFLKGVPAKTES